MQRFLRWSPAALFVLAACGGVASSDGADSDDLMPAVVSATPQLQLSHTLPRGGSSTLSVRTLPNAACTLRPANEAPGAQQHLRVYADDEGIARIHLTDTAGALQKGQLALDCADETGRKFTHSLSIATANGVRGMAPAAVSLAGKQVLLALTGNPLSYSDQDLAIRGYPPRPNAQTAPAQYQKWASLIALRPAVIAPHLVADASRSHGSGTSGNWSGYVISTPGSASQYGEIFGAWAVPHASAQSGFWHLNHSSFWVGIDGWGTPDVVQAGTDQDTDTIFWIQTSSYGAWTEWYPLSSQSISNFPVNPGDEIYTWVWVGNSAGAWTPSGGVGWFMLWNVTQNVITPHLSTAAPSGTVFNGHQAEWVMERPTVGGSLSTLANYGTAQITDAWAYDYADHAHYYTSDNSVSLSMTNGSDVLSTVAPVNSMAMQFTWHNYN